MYGSVYREIIFLCKSEKHISILEQATGQVNKKGPYQIDDTALSSVEI
ncbi:hypothetical protein FLA_5378 [Filimonas lacunae]|nr:hypothetical protein FLA_5378 [Filimonas lacunae]